MGFWQDVAHWMALVPLLVVGYRYARSLREPGRWDVSWEGGVVAVALGLSFVVDSFGRDLRDHGLPNLWLVYLLVPLQSALLVAACRPPWVAGWVGANLGLLSGLMAFLGLPGPVLAAIGGLTVTWLYRGEYTKAVRPCILWTAIGATLMGVGLVPVGWVLFQGARAIGIGLVAWRIGHGPGTPQDAPEGRRPVRPLRDTDRGHFSPEAPLTLPPGWFDGTASAEAGDPDDGNAVVFPGR